MTLKEGQYVVGHLLIIKTYAVKIGLVDIIDELVPSKMDVDPRTILLVYTSWSHGGHQKKFMIGTNTDIFF